MDRNSMLKVVPGWPNSASIASKNGLIASTPLNGPPGVNRRIVRQHTVAHHVRASLRPAEVESDYIRPYELSGEQLLLRYPVSAPDGEKRTRVLIWRRAERF